ncbi:MAG: hypothetical protein SFV81_22280 [Pirellulaceae bacterium]|nr:hypothetical protein [Pirellulaceae bacterium]
MKTLVNQLASGFVCIGLLLCSNGCTTRVDTVQSGFGSSASSYMLASEPAGALPVGEARNQIKDGDTVTLVGLIGGSSDPFVDGMAAFTIVDAKVPYCAPSEGCPTPWDYCCETAAVKENIATVTIVDEAGKPVMSDAKKLLNVKELAKITVQGKAKRDPQGNLAVYATKLFVANGK